MDSAGKDNVSNGEGQAEPQKPGEAAHAGTMPSSGSPNRRKRHRWGWICAAALALLGILLVLHNEKSRDVKTTEAAAQPPAAAVTVGQSKTGDINIYINALGTVTPVYTVTVYSQITGKVTTVHYKEGELVKAGDPLVDIDPQPYQATLAQAEGTLDHDQSVLEQARIDLARYEAAWARNAIARQQLEDQIQAVRQAEGSVKADQGTVAFDRVQLSYCHIVSPITGRVGLRLVDPGNTVFSGNSSTLVVITQLQPITVVFNVSEDDLSQIQTQLSAGRTLKVDAYDRANDNQIESRATHIVRQSGGHHHRNREIPSGISQRQVLAFSESVRQRAPSRANPAQGDAGSHGERAAQRYECLCLCRATRQHRQRPARHDRHQQ